MAKLCQFLTRLIQQFFSNTKIFKIRKQCDDFYLSGFTRAEAESNYFLIYSADVSR